jgi:hypothetical protein
VIQGAAEHFEALGGGDGLELKEGGTGDDGVIDVEVGIFGGGGDEGNAAVLHVFQQRLLLLTVEILDLVQVEEDAVCAEHALGLRQDILDVLEGGGGGVELMEFHARLGGDDRGGGGLARAGRAVEDHIGHAAHLHHAAENAVLSEQVGLTHDLVHGAGAQGIG